MYQLRLLICPVGLVRQTLAFRHFQKFPSVVPRHGKGRPFLSIGQSVSDHTQTQTYFWGGTGGFCGLNNILIMKFTDVFVLLKNT